MSSLLRVVTVAGATSMTRNPDQLARLGHDLQGALGALDMARVEPALTSAYQFVRADWIDYTMQNLDALARAARDGDVETVQDLTQRTRFTIGITRFQLTSAPSECATVDPTSASGGHTGTSDQFETASFTSPISAILNDAVPIEDAASRIMARAAANNRPPLETRIMIPLLVILAGIGIWFIGTRIRRAMVQADRRRAPRHSCAHPTQVRKLRATGLNRVLDQDDAGSQSAVPSRILDINRFGVSIAQTDPALDGDQIEVLVGDVWIAGHIIWSNQSCFGVQANAPIDDALVADVLGPGAPKTAGREPRLAFS